MFTGSAGVAGRLRRQIRISYTIEELIRFTLISGENFDLSLFLNFCSLILLNSENDTSFNSQLNDNQSGYGVPEYPLYKHLARELGKCLESEIFTRREDLGVNFPVEDECFRANEINWDSLISETGSKLSNMYESVNFELHVQEPYFTQLKDGTKKVEGRLATGNYNKVEQGSVLFNKCLLLKVEKVTKYDSFYEMLQMEKLENVLPGVSAIEEGVAVYRKFSQKGENLNGVLAISVSNPFSSQPYITMKEILNGLSYNGITRLLGP